MDSSVCCVVARAAPLVRARPAPRPCASLSGEARERGREVAHERVDGGAKRLLEDGQLARLRRGRGGGACCFAAP